MSFSINLLCIVLFLPFFKQVHNDDIHNKCRSKNSCSECTETSMHCSWCFDEAFSFARCDSEQQLREWGCRTNFILSNKNETSHKVLLDEPFEDVTNGDPKEAVQIRPQKLKIYLRPRETHTIQLKYRAAKNYPLDLYYAMDLTWSMRHDIATMVSLGGELAEELQTFTEFYRLAFGYFSDKIALPFAQMSKPFLKNPCSMHDGLDECTLGYDFKHNLNFTNDIGQFIKSVNSSSITSTVDNVEGAMDALFQIILCGRQMKWQKDSRKLIVLATDGLAHFGGDGKLSGTVQKPTKCSLDENGVYTQSLVNDYPSLEEIYRKLLEKKINVLFAAKSSVYKYYEKMSVLMSEVTYLTKLEEDSKNLLELVSKGYKNFISIVNFQPKTKPELPLTVKFTSSCNKPEFEQYWSETSGCNNVIEGHEYTFNVTFNLEKCPEESKNYKQTVVIEERNIVSEHLTIEFEYICGCKCNPEERKPEVCNGHGAKECGACKCDEGWGGLNCSCDLALKESTNLDEQCRNMNPNSTNIYMCSQNGNCMCGVCDCDEVHYGQYCECKKCPKHNGLECGGAFHGNCECGICACNTGYEGDSCGCSLSPNKCIEPGQDTVCSDRGECHCGSCKCKPIEVNNRTLKITGEYCDTCFECHQLCADYESCVTNFAKNITDTCSNDTHVLRYHSETSNKSDKVAYSKFNCTAMYQNEVTAQLCTVHYTHDLNSELLVFSEECEDKPLPAAVKIGTVIIFLLVLIGVLLMLLYKCVTHVQDKKTWAAHQKALNNTSYDRGENPLYISPITMHEVPRNLRD